jgi:hypothetical protein
MRTRTSWRNQNRLWRELGGRSSVPAKVDPTPVCGNCRHYQGVRNRGTCGERDVVVSCLERRECFAGSAR